jgi:multisubunit Na+/H+ antiporter MnhG subunit
MLFVYPMWDNESQRIGKQKCTPLGYRLHCIAELLGFIGLLLLFGLIAYFVYRVIVGTFHTSLLWLLTVPFVLGLIAEAIYQFSWVLAKSKDFHYDYDTREASWLEDGRRRVYKWSPKKS